MVARWSVWINRCFGWTRPTDPRGIKPDGRVVITSDTLLQLEKLPRKVAVVGAGVIGIEYATMFAALGVHVTVIDKRPRPLGQSFSHRDLFHSGNLLGVHERSSQVSARG